MTPWRRSIRAQPAAEEWRRRFAGKDVCCAIAATIEEAMRDPHFVARGLFAWERSTGDGGDRLTAVPVPVVPPNFARRRACAAPSLASRWARPTALLDEGDSP